VVAIVDKLAFFRVGVCHALSEQPDFEVFDGAPDDSLVALVEANSPDVLLLDIDYPSFSGLDLARKIILRCPTIKLMILTSTPDDKQLFEIIKAGAVGYLDKSIATDELVKTIRQVSRGEYPINDSVLARPKVAEHVLKQFQSESVHNISGKSISGKNMETIVVTPTFREMQILSYIAGGNSNKQIAQTLRISEQTIKNHISNILRKLNANDRAHAVVLAILYGWISAEELRDSGISANNN